MLEPLAYWKTAASYSSAQWASLVLVSRNGIRFSEN
jgi:hypothetical protein